MGIKKYTPTSPGTRFRSDLDNSDISKSRPVKRLTSRKKKNSGRNFNGRITSFQRGGGSKRLYRQIDFKRNKIGIPGTVSSLEYDPNRSARIALINYIDGRNGISLHPTV